MVLSLPVPGSSQPRAFETEQTIDFKTFLLGRSVLFHGNLGNIGIVGIAVRYGGSGTRSLETVHEQKLLIYNRVLLEKY